MRPENLGGWVWEKKKKMESNENTNLHTKYQYMLSQARVGSLTLFRKPAWAATPNLTSKPAWAALTSKKLKRHYMTDVENARVGSGHAHMDTTTYEPNLILNLPQNRSPRGQQLCACAHNHSTYSKHSTKIPKRSSMLAETSWRSHVTTNTTFHQTFYKHVKTSNAQYITVLF
jgi:hypothetical protein